MMRRPLINQTTPNLIFVSRFIDALHYTSAFRTGNRRAIVRTESMFTGNALVDHRCCEEILSRGCTTTARRVRQNQPVAGHRWRRIRSHSRDSDIPGSRLHPHREVSRHSPRRRWDRRRSPSCRQVCLARVIHLGSMSWSDCCKPRGRNYSNKVGRSYLSSHTGRMPLWRVANR